MLCPADNFFRAAKKVGIVPWHDDGDSSGDETPDRESTSKRRKVEIHQAKTVPECVPENAISFDEKSPHAPLPPAWHASLSATLGFSIRVTAPSTTAGRILQHCKARFEIGYGYF